MHLHKDTFVMQPSFGWTPLYDSGYFISSYFTASGREFLSLSGALCPILLRCLENISHLTNSPLLESCKVYSLPLPLFLLQHPSWLIEHCTTLKY